MTRRALPALAAVAVLGGHLGVAQAQPQPERLDCARMDCAAVLPGARRFEAVDGAPYVVGLADGTEPVGWVALSTDVVDIPAYSGKPLVTLIGLDTEGVITGARVLHHSEPILLVGIPESELHTFVRFYVGKAASSRIIVGRAAGGSALSVDAISGATVTALAQNRTILETARTVGAAVGVVRSIDAVPGHFVTEEQPWTWERMVEEEVFGRLTVTEDQMGVAGRHGTFVDLWFTIADAPQIGRALLGDGEYEHLRESLGEGEHLYVILGNGSSSFKGSSFVRGGLFDRVRVEQGLTEIMFRDTDYQNLSQVPATGAPRFREGAVFITRSGHLDPGAPFRQVFLGSRYDHRGGFTRDFREFSTNHRLPSSVYVLDGPDPNEPMWRQAWRNHEIDGPVLTAFLLFVIAVFAGRRFTTANEKWLERLHVGTMVVSFGLLGVWMGAQPSVTQILTVVDAIAHGWRWDLFLTEPLIFVVWIFIVLVSLLWGRGVFCGWVCPYGAMTELAFKIGAMLGIKKRELPDRLHKPLRYLRYVVLAALIPVFLWDSLLAERMAEVEPFKSTFLVPFWTRHWGFIAYWGLLFVVSIFWWRPFCRYLCPLGGGLALLGSVRVSGPYRRSFCSKCTICTKTCEPRAIRADGSIDARECLQCMQCEATYRNEQVCPPLVAIGRLRAKKETDPRASERLVQLRVDAKKVPLWRRPGASSKHASLVLLVLFAAPATARADVIRVGRDAPDVQTAVDQAQTGDVVIVPEGTWPGPVRVSERITLRGAGGVIDGGGHGTVITVSAPGAIVEHLTIRGSGSDLGAPDCCVYTEPTAVGATIQDNELEDCAFGIWIHESERARVRRNRVRGRADVRPADRGNGIHLFNASHLVVRDNEVWGARDGIYVSACEDSLIAGNLLRDQRYGMHYMYSYRNTLRGNRSIHNVGGFALMESRDLVVENNVAADNERVGLLFRDAQYCQIRGNRLEGNGQGMFFFSSTDNVIENNRLVRNDIGAKIWAGSLRNRVTGNHFLGNRQQVFFVGSEDLVWGSDGRGNYWSDYLGWDQNGDGVGDRPYRVDSFTANLLYQFPSAVLLLRSPTLELLTHLESTLPLLRVPSVVDMSPLLGRSAR